MVNRLTRFLAHDEQKSSAPVPMTIDRFLLGCLGVVIFAGFVCVAAACGCVVEVSKE